MAFLSLMSSPCAASLTSQTIYFRHRDDELLQPEHRKSGAVYVPTAALGQPGRPLVVMLHGLNPTGIHHLWMVPSTFDLRVAAASLIDGGTVEPFILAAPAQNRNAGRASTLWAGFDLARFVDDTIAALGGAVTIDRSRVVLMGHSGAGCHQDTGVFNAAKTMAVSAVIAADVCMDKDIADALGALPPTIPLWVLWQPYTWQRNFPTFRQRVIAARTDRAITMFDRLTSHTTDTRDAHDFIVPAAMARVLPEILPAGKPHEGTTPTAVR